MSDMGLYFIWKHQPDFQLLSLLAFKSACPQNTVWPINTNAWIKSGTIIATPATLSYPLPLRYYRFKIRVYNILHYVGHRWIDIGLVEDIFALSLHSGIQP